ncbi:MAG: hypothetical protein VB119_04250 [Candidatus Metalachnospira sp.]|nr:hypothetical protein [Candidatus Metalachnospira sp.]
MDKYLSERKSAVTRLQRETIDTLSKLNKDEQQDKLINVALELLSPEKADKFRKKLKEI